ncbi:MAG: phosphoribosylformylglycinamidine synthase [Flavobacteriaceae bacterium]
MIYFFGKPTESLYAVQTTKNIDPSIQEKLVWLFGNQKFVKKNFIEGNFIGPRATMITPWSTNAVEITQNMDIEGISRIEMFIAKNPEEEFDPMLYEVYNGLDQSIFDIDVIPEPMTNITNIEAYNQKEGLALSKEEITYLEGLSKSLGRPLTDSEVFGFSQVNSEHCRHKIFNGRFVIDGTELEESLFQMIKKTSKTNPNSIVSAYKDNVAFVLGPEIEQFAPKDGSVPSVYEISTIKSVISLKAETHNFPTTVEPFNGAATGSGGEIRDRLAGGQGSLPLAGTAVYMTPYSRVKGDRKWEEGFPKRKWLYQTPLDLLIKASNGASDFGNKFGQPLISGSVLTFEHQEKEQRLGYDKVIMLAGGVGYGTQDQAQKKMPKRGDMIVILGGDNYRIGMGGAAVSSANTGAFSNEIELNAVQRSNPEMQKRVANAIRALVERSNNPIISIHDHGAGGHLNCLSELVEDAGGEIHINQLPLGDPTLSAKEIIGNESQERMGLILSKKDTLLLKKISLRERTPLFIVGQVTGDHHFSFVNYNNGEKPIDLAIESLFGDAPKTTLLDEKKKVNFDSLSYDFSNVENYLKNVLLLESVGCKDWLTNKVDRCVTGRVAQQQTVGELQLPLSNCGVMALDYNGKYGVATAIGHAPVTGLIDPAKGSINSIAESLTNIVWAPLTEGLKSVSLSANWMWPCNNPGENDRLYRAVKACSDFAIDLGINIPTGKDSLSMKQKYKEGDVLAPGTVIISSAGQCEDIKRIVTPVCIPNKGMLYYINLSSQKHVLGGSSLGQVLNKIGSEAPGVDNIKVFKNTFNVTQELILNEKIISGHDISSGGLITSLLEMCFPSKKVGMEIDMTLLNENDTIALLFSENSGLVLQSEVDLTNHFGKYEIECYQIGKVTETGKLIFQNNNDQLNLDVAEYRDLWFSTSAALDAKQNNCAEERFANYKIVPLKFNFPSSFNGKLSPSNNPKIKAAVIREKGSNSEREMAYAMFSAGFEVYDIHMTDLIEGRKTLEEFKFIAAVGGFSNSDVLGSAKGWAGAFLYNPRAKKSLDDFFAREDTLSLGVCNGCQLFVELGMITPTHKELPKMNRNTSGKFECQFTAVNIGSSSSIMLRGLEGSTLGIWAAHGEGKFHLPMDESQYQIPGKYHKAIYPANPNGSDYNAAMLCSEDGRHLVMMPHLERSTFPWNWAHYPKDRCDEFSPWIIGFENAKRWLETK